MTVAQLAPEALLSTVLAIMRSLAAIIALLP
jgi:hypothetical protein